MTNKMRYRLWLPLIIVTSVVFILSSCSRKGSSEDQSLNYALGFLHFKNLQDYYAQKCMLESYTLEERSEYERSNGYTSFGSVCDKKFGEIELDDLKSLSDVIDLVENNKDYFRLIKDNDGELTFEMALYNNPDRYLINVDRIYAVGNNVYKVLDDVTISTKFENLTELNEVNESNISKYYNRLDYSIVRRSISSPIKDAVTIKDGNYNCGDEFYDESQDGGERTKLWLNWLVVDHGYGLFAIESGITIKPYTRILGIWFSCSRAVNCNISYATDLMVNLSGIWLPRRVYYESFAQIGSNITRSHLEYLGSLSSASYHFAGYEGWEKTTTTPTIYLTCNKAVTYPKYQCNVCGYIYDPLLGDAQGGIGPETSFSDLPASWVCPDCGAEKELFEPY
jgi:rubredoxin